jgi:hypothetical protein
MTRVHVLDTCVCMHTPRVAGVGRDVPVYVERPLVDFGCCSLGHLYRDVLLVRNYDTL